MGDQEHLQLGNGLLPDAIHGNADAHRPGLGQLLRVERLHFEADQLREVIATIHATLDEDDPVVLQLVTVLRHRLREDHDFHGATQVLQVEDGHEVPAPRPLLGEVRDHATDHPEGAVIDVG